MNFEIILYMIGRNTFLLKKGVNVTMKTQRVSTEDLTSDMTVTEDVLNSSGQLIIPKNTVITQRVIDRLKYYAIPSITISAEDNVDLPPSPDEAPKKKEKKIVFEETIEEPSTPKEEATYSERIVNSPEFKKFKKEYVESLQGFQQQLNGFVSKNMEPDLKQITQFANSLIGQNDTSIHIFDMLHNMHSFDDSTYSHSLNVALICHIIGSWLHFSEEDINVLCTAGMLHDIGKLMIDESILKKPGKLTDEEYAIMKTHPMKGFNFVKNLNMDQRIKGAILMHHERCDGTGYPMGFPANKIHSFAKIVAIADTYDAMTSNRVYRKALCPFEVIRLYEQEGYQKYDVKTLLTFLNGIVQTYINNHIQLSDGSIGDIVMINQNNLSNPIVKVGEKFIDLSTEPNLNITAIL